MNFGAALAWVKGGSLVHRTGWNGKGMHVGLHKPHAHDKMDVPFLYLLNAQGEHIPWLASQGDVLAEDWQITGDDR